MSTTSTQTWEYKNISYVEHGGMIIYADRCLILEGSGVILYKNDKIISTINMNVSGIYEDRDHQNKLNHYFIRTSDSPSIYLHMKPRKETTYRPELNGKVYARFIEDESKKRNMDENDMTNKLAYGLSQDLSAIEKLKDEIELNYSWEITENIEGRYVRIRKGDKERFVSSDIVATYDEIKELAHYYHKHFKN